jgi:hypothetical protein
VKCQSVTESVPHLLCCCAASHWVLNHLWRWYTAQLPGRLSMQQLCISLICQQWLSWC